LLTAVSKQNRAPPQWSLQEVRDFLNADLDGADVVEQAQYHGPVISLISLNDVFLWGAIKDFVFGPKTPLTAQPSSIHSGCL
jgi:hypothetical protein